MLEHKRVRYLAKSFFLTAIGMEVSPLSLSLFLCSIVLVSIRLIDFISSNHFGTVNKQVDAVLVYRLNDSHCNFIDLN